MDALMLDAGCWMLDGPLLGTRSKRDSHIGDGVEIPRADMPLYPSTR